VSNSTEQLNYEELERLHYHADTTLHSRVNILLVAESIFLAALAQVWANAGLFFMQVALCVLGLLVTILVRSSTATLARRTEWLAAKRTGLSPTYKGYLESIPKPPNQTRRLASTLPLLFLIGWAALLVVVVVRSAWVMNIVN